jgi:hypothetical protein
MAPARELVVVGVKGNGRGEDAISHGQLELVLLELQARISLKMTMKKQ